jgi:hypothetical protein
VIYGQTSKRGKNKRRRRKRKVDIKIGQKERKEEYKEK